MSPVSAALIGRRQRQPPALGNGDNPHGVETNSAGGEAVKIILELTPAPGPWPAPVVARLKRLLKAAKRGYGFKAVGLRLEANPPPPGRATLLDHEPAQSLETASHD